MQYQKFDYTFKKLNDCSATYCPFNHKALDIKVKIIEKISLHQFLTIKSFEL